MYTFKGQYVDIDCTGTLLHEKMPTRDLYSESGAGKTYPKIDVLHQQVKVCRVQSKPTETSMTVGGDFRVTSHCLCESSDAMLLMSSSLN